MTSGLIPYKDASIPSDLFLLSSFNIIKMSSSQPFGTTVSTRLDMMNITQVGVLVISSLRSECVWIKTSAFKLVMTVKKQTLYGGPKTYVLLHDDLWSNPKDMHY